MHKVSWFRVSRAKIPPISDATGPRNKRCLKFLGFVCRGLKSPPNKRCIKFLGFVCRCVEGLGACDIYVKHKHENVGT